MSLTIYTHPDCERHEMPGHPERPERLRAVMDRLTASGLAAEAGLVEARQAEPAALQRIHPQPFISQLIDSEPAHGLCRVDADTYMSPGSIRAAALAAGACIQAVEDLLSGSTARAFCAVRPPGHHAEVAVAMGFCLFNNVALAAETALQHPDVSRVAILDFDVHHCNGTVDIFKDRPEVLVCSSFQDHFYPNRYLDFENGHILNTPLDAGADGPEFRRRVERSWFPALLAHRPDILLVSAGFDAHRADPLGGLNFVEDDYAWITGELVNLADELCHGRIMSTLEGGYDLNALAGSVEAHVGALLHPGR